MELVSTMEINGEEREIADAYARERIATNAQNIATNAEGIAGLNNNLSQLEIDLKMLGYTVPKEMPVQNYVDADGVFHQRVGRVDLGELEWNYTYDGYGRIFFKTSSDNINLNTPIDSTAIFSAFSSIFKTTNWNTINWSDGTKNLMAAYSGMVGFYYTQLNDSTDTMAFKQAMQGVYLYYKLAEEITTSVDGNEAVTKVNDSLSVIGKCKNLLKPTLKTTTVNGVTCTNNGDGTYTLNGVSTDTDNWLLSFKNIKLKKGKKYKLIGFDTITTDLYFKASENEFYSYNNNGIFTNSQEREEIYIRFNSGITFDNVIVKPMITENLNATYDDFVPYTGDGDTLTEDVASLKSDLSDCCKKSDITTNETLIGTFNGKNYYRRLFTGIGASGSSVTVNVGEKIEIYNYYGRAYVYGQSGASAAKYPIPNKNYYIESQNISETSFQLTMPTSSDMRKIDLVIEYTKVDE